MDYQRRQTVLRQALQRSRASGLLVTHLPNLRYLCGFTGSAGVLACRLGHARGDCKLAFFTDGRYTQQAREEVQGARVCIAKGPALPAATAWLSQGGLSPIAIEADHMSIAQRETVASCKHPRSRLRPTRGLVESLRMVKEEEELEQIEAAVVLASSLFDGLLRSIAPGVPESQVAAELEYAARRAGAQGMSFETIVAAGPRSALPHGRASSQPIPNKGFVILDFGVILSGYCSDMTRTLYVGRPTARARRLYQAVREAQQAGVGEVRPGVTVGEVDRAARRVLERAGLGRYFTHSTGHGVGLEIHEPPRLGRGEREVLQPGMVITVEPGVYLPGEGGVRIEDMLVVTDTGSRVLTPTSKELITL
ncbi:MAG TPA: aminopeptidase P family protein [Terriglobales bacterium]|jgi:Xaa-Pro aminopeptidase|nr:aminopeptidase P family protein [Terriglobales bacterium]